MTFNFDKLEINFLCSNNCYHDLSNRKYTLTNNNKTGILNLDIGNVYNYSKVNFNLRDEILGEWILIDKNTYNLFIYIFLKGYYPYEVKYMYDKFKECLPLAIHHIINSDLNFINQNKYLYNSSIIVNFHSSYFMFNSRENYGRINQYIINKET